MDLDSKNENVKDWRFNLSDEEIDGLIELLPVKLQRDIVNPYAFCVAIVNKKIVIENGRFRHKFEHDCILAMFCGHCFAGDTLVIGKVRKRIVKGKHKFPATELQRLFIGVENMRIARENVKKNKKFSYSEDVERLMIL